MSEESFRTTHLQDCLRRMQAGEAKARDDLILDCQERLRRLARKMLKGYPGVGRWVETDDVLQDTLPRLLKALEEANPKSVREFFSLAAWKMRQVLLDLARHYRTQLAHHKSVAGASGSANPVLDGSDMTHEPSGLAEWCELHQKIEQLPTEEKEVVDLHFYQGLPFSEIAALLKVSERTAQRRWSAALLRLHDLLGGEFPEL